MLYLVSARNLPITHEGIKITRLQAYLTDDENFIKGLTGKNVWVEHARPEQIGVYYSQFAHAIDSLGGIRSMISKCSDIKADKLLIEQLKLENDALKQELESLKKVEVKVEESEMPCGTKAKPKAKPAKKPATPKEKK